MTKCCYGCPTLKIKLCKNPRIVSNIKVSSNFKNIKNNLSKIYFRSYTVLRKCFRKNKTASVPFKLWTKTESKKSLNVSFSLFIRELTTFYNVMEFFVNGISSKIFLFDLGSFKERAFNAYWCMDEKNLNWFITSNWIQDKFLLQAGIGRF